MRKGFIEADEALEGGLASMSPDHGAAAGQPVAARLIAGHDHAAPYSAVFASNARRKSVFAPKGQNQNLIRAAMPRSGKCGQLVAPVSERPRWQQE